MAFDPIYSHKYFHICIYFIHQVIADFSKHAARAIATLHNSVIGCFEKRKKTHRKIGVGLVVILEAHRCLKIADFGWAFNMRVVLRASRCLSKYVDLMVLTSKEA